MGSQVEIWEISFKELDLEIHLYLAHHWQCWKSYKIAFQIQISWEKMLVWLEDHIMSDCQLPWFYKQTMSKVKQKRFKEIAWISSHHLHLQWKFKLLVGKFTWGNKAKHCWGMSTNFLFSTTSNVLPLQLKQTFPLIIWISLKVKVMRSN